jgi:hypothetical protein
MTSISSDMSGQKGSYSFLSAKESSKHSLIDTQYNGVYFKIEAVNFEMATLGFYDINDVFLVKLYIGTDRLLTLTQMKSHSININTALVHVIEEVRVEETQRVEELQNNDNEQVQEITGHLKQRL